MTRFASAPPRSNIPAHAQQSPSVPRRGRRRVAGACRVVGADRRTVGSRGRDPAADRAAAVSVAAFPDHPVRGDRRRQRGFDRGDPARDCRLPGGRAAARSSCRRAGFSRAGSGLPAASTCTSQEGATLAFSRDPAQYLPLVFTRFEGIELMNYSPFIYAFEQPRTSRSPARARSTGRPTPSTGGTGAAMAAHAERDAGRQRGPALIEMGVRGVPVDASACSATGTTCGRTSSSRTAAERADRGRDDRQLADVGDQSRCCATNVTVRDVTIAQPRAEQRRLRSRVVPRRADRRLHVRHRRRLHRAQVGPQRRRPAPQRADRERHRPQLHDEGRPRRRRDRQRDLGRRAQHVRRAVPDGQPAASIARCASRPTPCAAASIEHIYMRDVHRRAGRRGGA